MDSIELLRVTAGKMGLICSVTVSNGNIYRGVYRGFCDSTAEAPLSLRLQISEEEANRIGIPWITEIGVSYVVIRKVEF